MFKRLKKIIERKFKSAKREKEDADARLEKALGMKLLTLPKDHSD